MHYSTEKLKVSVKVRLCRGLFGKGFIATLINLPFYGEYSTQENSLLCILLIATLKFFDHTVPPAWEVFLVSSFTVCIHSWGIHFLSNPLPPDSLSLPCSTSNEEMSLTSPEIQLSQSFGNVV